MLSGYSSTLTSKHVTSEKSPNLYDKTNYVSHYENIRLFIKHWLQLLQSIGF